MRDLGLLPAPSYIQNLDHNLLNYLDIQFRRIEENWRILDSSAPSGAAIPAGNVVAGTFGSNVGNGNYTFPGALTVLDRLELRKVGTPYIDFSRDMSQDYNVRLESDAVGFLTLTGGKFHTAQAEVGTYDWDTSWAHFGHRSRMNVNSATYAFMHHGSTGETIVSSEATTYLRSSGAAERLRLNGNGVEWYTSQWMRDNVLYIRSPGDTNHAINYDGNPNGIVLRSWDRTGFYRHAGGGYVAYVTSGRSSFADGTVGTWAGAGGHACFGQVSAADSKGWLTRNDGNLWVMMETQMFIRGNDGGDYFNFYRFGDVRLNVPTVAPGDPDLRIAGSHQLLRNASNRKFKKNIKALRHEDNPVWDIPTVTYHWKDDAREHGARFNARHEKGCPGFIAEDLYKAAPSACTVDTTTGEPNGPDTWVLLAYIIAGLQELRGMVEAK